MDGDLEKQDNEIFEIARSMTCIQFKNIVMEDLLKGLLGVAPVGGGVSPNFQEDVVSPISILLASLIGF